MLSLEQQKNGKKNDKNNLVKFEFLSQIPFPSITFVPERTVNIEYKKVHDNLLDQMETYRLKYKKEFKPHEDILM